MLPSLDLLMAPNELVHQLSAAQTFEMYIFLGIVIFFECGVIFCFFLPGDSFLFMLGMLSYKGVLNPSYIAISCIVCAILGNLFNYYSGRLVGGYVIRHKREWIGGEGVYKKSQDFFQKYGYFSVFVCRFLPVLRTVMPFLSGAAMMPIPLYVMSSILGGIFWVLSMGALGYLLGKIPFIQEHMTLLILCIMSFTLISMAIYIFQRYRQLKKEKN